MWKWVWSKSTCCTWPAEVVTGARDGGASRRMGLGTGPCSLELSHCRPNEMEPPRRGPCPPTAMKTQPQTRPSGLEHSQEGHRDTL